MAEALPRVPAADLARNFGHWREVGGRAPVFVTSHGRVTHVLMGVDRYEALAERRPLEGDAATDAYRLYHALAGWVGEGVILCDARGRILHANRVADALCGHAVSLAAREELWSALPALRGTMAEMHIRRAMLGGEPGSVDIPSPFRTGAALRLQAVPVEDGTLLLLRDRSGAGGADEAGAALAEAVRHHPAAGFVRLSARGFIEEANAAFATFVGLPPARIEQAAMWDLLALSARPAFRAAIEPVLRGEGRREIAASLLDNRGAAVPVTLLAAPVRGAYGADGAVLLLTAAR